MIADEEGRGGEKVRQRRRWLLQAAIFAPPAVAKSCKSLNEHQLGSEMKHNDIHTVRRCYMRCCEVLGWLRSDWKRRWNLQWELTVSRRRDAAITGERDAVDRMNLPMRLDVSLLAGGRRV